ncbi:MAG: NAD-dependent epimerase/dehydratase family protein [Candidatus Woesearchaeota archaeon]
MKEKTLVTGAFGQIGSELVPALQQKFGKENVLALGRNIPNDFDGFSVQLDVMDFEKVEDVIKKNNVKTIYHLVSLLSATGEKDPNLAWNLNMGSLKFILDMAIKYKIKVFWPSSIAAFGPTTPRIKTPQKTILEPTTMYGVTKVSGELLCQYYHLKYNVDVRSVRYPGIISWKQEPGGGTTDYAVAIFYDGIKYGKYKCFVKPETVLPMMYMDDAVEATLKLMEAPQEKLTIRTSYNLAAISFSAKELADEINKHIKVDVSYEPDHRQKIADSWPMSIDDSQARKDWGWQHKYDLSKMTLVMLENLKKKLK